MPSANAIRRHRCSPTLSLVPAESSSRFQPGFLPAGTVLSLPLCITFNPQFCCSEQFLPSCLAQTPGPLATRDTNILWMIRFFVEYKAVDTRAVINCAVPQLGMPVRAKIISRCLSAARYKVSDNGFSYCCIFSLFD